MSKVELNELRRRMNRSMSRVLNLIRTNENYDAVMPTKSFEPRITAPLRNPQALGYRDPIPGPKKPPPAPPNTPTGDHAAEAPSGVAVLSMDHVSDEEGPASSPTLLEMRNSPPPTPPPSPPPSPPRTRNRWEIEALGEAMPQLEEILEGADYEEVESMRVVVKRPHAGWLLVGRPPASPYQPCGYDGDTMVSYGVFVIKWVGVDLWLLGDCEGEDVERELFFGRAVRAEGTA